MKRDTIAAIATGTTNSGISIIRISGTEAFRIAENIFFAKKSRKKLSEQKTHTIHYGEIRQDNCCIDEVLVSVMKAPNTYTKEDVIEINCHGGMLVTKKILSIILQQGARLAQPGEFTKRAFLNGRIDLSQAEAVIDIIHATNEQAVKNSVRQLGGALYRTIKEIRDSIIKDAAFIEAALDDPEHISLDGFTTALREHTKTNLNRIEKLLFHAQDGKIIKEGIRTVILGKPNAGKSTLLNLLVGEDRAIVTEIPGTTRDTLEEMIQINGIVLRIVDTAGIRNTNDVVEQIGVKKAIDEAKDADLVLYVADASRAFDENDEKVISLLSNKKAIVLLNKSDLKMQLTKEILEEKTGKPAVVISAKEKQGTDQLSQVIEQMFYQGIISSEEEIFITNLRHEQALCDAKDSLNQVLLSLDNEMPEDFYSIDLMNAYSSLGEIIGEAVDEDLINKIFSDFCMGK